MKSINHTSIKNPQKSTDDTDHTMKISIKLEDVSLDEQQSLVGGWFPGGGIPWALGQIPDDQKDK